MHTGKGASQWEDFKTHNRVAVGGSDDEDWSNKSLDDMKKQWPGHPHDVRTAQAISKNMKEGDAVVALGGSKKVKGIGIITSDYMPPTHSENTEHEYKHSRAVKWLIIDDLSIESNQFPNITITRKTKNGDKKWAEIKNKYIAINPDYKKIFTGLNPNLSDLIKLFMRELDGKVLQELQEHHNRRYKNVQDILTKDNLATLSESDMRKILDDTDAARGMKMTIGSIIPKNDGIEKFKEKLINLLDKTDRNETDINKLIKSFKGMGPGILSELLCLKDPNKFWITNKVTDEYFSLMGIDIKSGIPRGKKGDDGLKYVAMEPHLQKIRDMLKDNGFQNATFLDADMFAYWTTLWSPTPPELQEPPFEPLHEAFTHTKNVILYGPPGTGKTYQACKFIKEFLKNRDEIKQYYEFVTFHQSYGYEDFIEGLKPIVKGGNISYDIEPGVFKQFCDKAKNDKKNNYLFVIDEINRGNISKIFGELITLIEDDKRNKIQAKLPYSKTEFTVPSNIYILGTMNTADRSIALLDIALRRRFTFLELMPDSSLLNHEIDNLDIGVLLAELNKNVTKSIDREHQIGHSYFFEVVAQIKKGELESAKKGLHFVWYRKIIPLLQEYFYHDWTQLKQVLGNFVSNTDIDNSISEFESQDERFMNALKSIANNSTKQNNQGDEIKSGNSGEEGE